MSEKTACFNVPWSSVSCFPEASAVRVIGSTTTHCSVVGETLAVMKLIGQLAIFGSPCLVSLGPYSDYEKS